MGNDRILAVIPARGGSKGIPRKNIADVCGKPLIAYTIEPALAAHAAGLLKEVVVSTDDAEIAAVARCFGAAVPFLRPAGLAGDKARSAGVLLHALDWFACGGGDRFDAVLLLQPTCPLRTLADIEAALQLWPAGRPGAESLISVYREDYATELVMYRRDGTPLHPAHNRGVRRQEQQPVYVRNGALYVTAAHYLRRTGWIVSDRPLLHEMPKRRSLNIDTEEDLAFARQLLCE
ncbi:acylneuraminate cytidylyltransferase family protein [Paenibacillus cymbidii]|uniref:acylneuraminate cytidylyltransferase family protein n=1 Tax=Paenibacillus cymbidii TaxID=1639034 RepID=UPI0010806FCA|nr:acylneuraminate cytidylyltransferase family protein [Paenibacillus cymbidii]